MSIVKETVAFINPGEVLHPLVKLGCLWSLKNTVYRFYDVAVNAGRPS